jgi:hypothetical protein
MTGDSGLTPLSPSEPSTQPDLRHRVYDGIRCHPRFVNLVASTGLPPSVVTRD